MVQTDMQNTYTQKELIKEILEWNKIKTEGIIKVRDNGDDDEIYASRKLEVTLCLTLQIEKTILSLLSISQA